MALVAHFLRWVMVDETLQCFLVRRRSIVGIVVLAIDSHFPCVHQLIVDKNAMDSLAKKCQQSSSRAIV